MWAIVCPFGMSRFLATYQAVYPSSTRGRNRGNIRIDIPLGAALPGPPGMNSNVFGPVPQRT